MKRRCCNQPLKNDAPLQPTALPLEQPRAASKTAASCTIAFACKAASCVARLRSKGAPGAACPGKQSRKPARSAAYATPDLRRSPWNTRRTCEGPSAPAARSPRPSRLQQLFSPPPAKPARLPARLLLRAHVASLPSFQ